MHKMISDEDTKGIWHKTIPQSQIGGLLEAKKSEKHFVSFETQIINKYQKLLCAFHAKSFCIII